jgi:hypothetical protein
VVAGLGLSSPPGFEPGSSSGDGRAAGLSWVGAPAFEDAFPALEDGERGFDSARCAVARARLGCFREGARFFGRSAGLRRRGGASDDARLGRAASFSFAARRAAAC